MRKGCDLVQSFPSRASHRSSSGGGGGGGGGTAAVAAAVAAAAAAAVAAAAAAAGTAACESGVLWRGCGLGSGCAHNDDTGGDDDGDEGFGRREEEGKWE